MIAYAAICRFSQFQLTQSDTVPGPDQEWSKERRERLQAFLYGAGEQEVLMNNTGEPEYKTYMNQKLKGRLYPLMHYEAPHQSFAARLKSIALFLPLKLFGRAMN